MHAEKRRSYKTSAQRLDCSLPAVWETLKVAHVNGGRTNCWRRIGSGIGYLESSSYLNDGNGCSKRCLTTRRRREIRKLVTTASITRVEQTS